MELAENSNRTFWLNGRRPMLPFNYSGATASKIFPIFFFPWFVRICLSYVLIKVSWLQKCLYSQMP